MYPEIYLSRNNKTLALSVCRKCLNENSPLSCGFKLRQMQLGGEKLYKSITRDCKYPNVLMS
jgi:hypothetical protein